MQHVSGREKNDTAAHQPRTGRNPDPLVQRGGRPDQSAGAAARAEWATGDAGADGGHLPDADPRAGNVGRALDRHSRGSAPDLRAVAPVAALSRAASGAGARHAGQAFLQVRRRLAGRFAQAEFRRAAGLLQQDGRHQAADHRDRRRPVGFVDRFRRPDVRPAGARLHGQGQLRAEAFPPFDDADLGRRGVRQSEQPDQRRARRAGRRSRQRGLARPGDFRGGRGSRGRTRHLLHARLGAQPRSCCTRR